MTRPKTPVRTWLVNLVLCGVAFGLLALVVRANRTQIQEVFRRPIDWRLFGLGFAVMMVGLVLTFVRWFFLVRALGLPFRLRDALRLGFIGNVFNLVIPGAVGGDLIKAAFLCREQARKTQAVASMVIDRLVGLLGLFVLAGLTGVVILPQAGPEVRRLIAVVWAAVACGVVGLTVLFTPALYRPLARLVAGRRRLETLFQELIAMAAQYRERLGAVVGCQVLAVGIHALYVLAFFAADRALFPDAPSLAQHFLMVPLTLFTTAVPLPFGALGLTEGVSAQLFRLVHHPGGAVAMMGYRVLMYAAGAVSVAVYLANLRQVKALTHEAEAWDEPEPVPIPEPEAAAASGTLTREAEPSRRD